MRLKRLLLCFAVKASEKSASDEIQETIVGRAFGLSDTGHVHTTVQTSINQATAASSYNLQSCLESGGVWNNLGESPYCSLPIVASTAAPTAAHVASPDQAKIDCIQGGHYWITNDGGGFSYCSWTAPVATQLPETTPVPVSHLDADSFDNRYDCESNGFYWHQFPTYGYCEEEPESIFLDPQTECMKNNGRWIADYQFCEMSCSQCQGFCGTDLVCVCGNGQYGQNCEFCSTGFQKVADGSCILDITSVTDCDRSNCNYHGACSLKNGVKSCNCDNGFTGARCEDIVVELDQCRYVAKNCNGHGTCRTRVVNSVTFPECTCYSGYEGKFCEDKIIQLDPCIPLNFCNNGNCIRERNGNAYCLCSQGWKGDTCLEKKTISCSDLNCNNGNCIREQNGNAYCLCSQGWEGKTCLERKRDFRCADQSFCSNGGVCMETTTTKYCKCPDGYEGANCQYPPGTPKCDYTDCNNGVCEHDNDGYPKCHCNNGWKGPYCNIAIPCTRDCAFGRCAHGKNSQYCADCPENFFGRDCKYDCSACGDGEICDKTLDAENNVISAKCIVKPVSVCEASTNVCLNGCTCVDSVKDGYFFTCQNALNRNFLGKRCQWDEPTLDCGTDTITISITNAFHENFSFSSKKYSVGSYSKLVDSGRSSTELIISQNENPDVFRTRVVDGSLVMSSDVVLGLTRDSNPNFSTQMRIMTFACKYSIEQETSDVFNPVHWPSETLVQNNVNFNVDLKFYSVDASYESHRRARDSAFVLHGEEVYVSASVHDSVDHLPSGVNLFFENCDLRQGSSIIPAIANGCPVINTSGKRNFVDVDFNTEQPTNGLEFKMTVLGFQNTNSNPLSLTCEVSFCHEGQGSCNNSNCNGRRKRAISSPTITLEVSPIFILTPGELQTSRILLS